MTEHLRTPQRSMQEYLADLNSEALVAKFDLPDRHRVRRVLETVNDDLTYMFDSLPGNPFEPEEEFVLMPNILPTEEAAVHKELLEAIQPETNFIPDVDQIIRDESNAITAVVQYKNCPTILPLIAEGVEYRWYMRKIGVIGETEDFGEVRVFQGKPAENLILRRKIIPRNKPIDPSLN